MSSKSFLCIDLTCNLKYLSHNVLITVSCRRNTILSVMAYNLEETNSARNDVSDEKSYSAGYSQCMADMVRHLTQIEDAVKLTKTVIQTIPVQANNSRKRTMDARMSNQHRGPADKFECGVKKIQKNLAKQSTFSDNRNLLNGSCSTPQRLYSVHDVGSDDEQPTPLESFWHNYVTDKKLDDDSVSRRVNSFWHGFSSIVNSSVSDLSILREGKTDADEPIDLSCHSTESRSSKRKTLQSDETGTKLSNDSCGSDDVFESFKEIEKDSTNEDSPRKMSSQNLLNVSQPHKRAKTMETSSTETCKAPQVKRSLANSFTGEIVRSRNL